MGKKKPTYFALGLSYILIMCLPAVGYAMDVTLAWDANTEPTLAGYAIYYGIESGDPYDGEGALEGDSPVDLSLEDDEDPDPDVVQFTLHDLPEGTHFFAVTALATDGVESGYSNEASTAAYSGPITEEAAGFENAASTQGTSHGGGGCFISTATYAATETTKAHTSR